MNQFTLSAERLSLAQLFSLDGRVAVITGGAGLLGVKHAEAIAAANGIPVLADLALESAEQCAAAIGEAFQVQASAVRVDITNPAEVEMLREEVLARYGRLDILINNAAHDPKVEKPQNAAWSRFEHFPLADWNADIAVGLTGAFLCCQILGSEMARRRSGVIVNIASDLAVIAPDQRLYRVAGIGDDEQPAKAVSYSVVKTGLIGLTRYLATYWADRGVRVNAISPGGVFNNQSDAFVQRVSSLIPLGRMARQNEYQGALVFLCSDASSYMTGMNLVVDGGRSVW